MDHDSSSEPGGTHKVESSERCWGKQQYVTTHMYQVCDHPHVPDM